MLIDRVAIADDPSPPLRGGRHAPLVAVVAAAASGIVIDRLASHHSALHQGPLVGCGLWWLVVAAALVAWGLLWRRARYRVAAPLLLLAIAALFGGAHHWHWNLFSANDAGFYATEQNYPCCFEAVAITSPERVAAPPESPFRAIPQSEKSQLLVHVTRIRNGQHWQPASGNCELIVDGHLLGVAARDQLRVFGMLRRPSPARNPGQFDYEKHSRADRQLCYVRSTSPDCVAIVERGSDWHPLRWIDAVRSDWQSRLWATLDSTQAPIAAAILLGARNSMPRETVDAFRVTGALHVLVVSGLHAGILVAGIFALLGMGLLPRRTALAVAMVLVALYAAFTGGHPPVVRAAILAELACVALWFDRNPFALNSLAVAAMVVLAINPADLFRTGPQLSFLCVATLMWFGSVRWLAPPTPLKTLLFNARPWYEQWLILFGRRLAWTVAATLAVWVLSLPILMHQYHLVSPVAVVACVPVFFSLTASLISGFAFLLGGWLLPVLELPLGWLFTHLLSTLDGFVAWSSEWPNAYFWTPGPAAWWVLGWYAMAAMLLCSGGTRWGWRRTVQVAAVWAIVGAVPAVADRWSTRELQATFLDVGHGVCVVVTTPDGATLLYDAGSLGSPSYATETIAGYLWSRGIGAIDGLVLSHADVDHFNAVPGLIERFRVGRVFVSPHMFSRIVDPADQSAPAELKRLLNWHKIPIEVVELGDRLTLDPSTHANVLYPDHLGSFGTDNANSLVLAIESGPYRILLPGDLESPGLDDMLADEPYDCSLLLAPHHGSRGSDPPGLAAWSRPNHVVISGSDAVDRNVLASYRRYGAKILHTAECGAIEFVFAHPGLKTVRYRP